MSLQRPLVAWAGPASNWEYEQSCNSSSACALTCCVARLWGFHGNRLNSLQLLGRKGKLPPTQIEAIVLCSWATTIWPRCCFRAEAVWFSPRSWSHWHRKLVHTSAQPWPCAAAITYL